MPHYRLHSSSFVAVVCGHGINSGSKRMDVSTSNNMCIFRVITLKIKSLTLNFLFCLPPVHIEADILLVDDVT